MKENNSHFTKIGLKTVIVVLILFAANNLAWAKDSHTVHQKDHQFSELFLKVKNNDVIKFVNLDTVKHKLVFSHKGRQEQMNAIEPGKTQEVTFSHSGIYDVQCKHHPEMKLTIFVPYVANLTNSDSIYIF